MYMYFFVSGEKNLLLKRINVTLNILIPAVTCSSTIRTESTFVCPLRLLVHATMLSYTYLACPLILNQYIKLSPNCKLRFFLKGQTINYFVTSVR
jgi:hypothetical protein